MKSTVSQTTLLALFAPPTRSELRACYELCRLHNNIGFWVVWLPTAWSIAMAYRAIPELTAHMCLRKAAEYVPLCFGIKSLIMTIDDILDYDIDALVERTKMRAIPRGDISPARAWMFFGLQAVLGVWLAKICLGDTALKISMAVWPLYIIYPTCKRWMGLAPIPLGIMFKVGIFMGWSDVISALPDHHTIPWRILVPFYIGCCLWTFTYETVYQHQDKQDDALIGLHSPALLLGRTLTYILTSLTGIGFFTLMAYAFYLNGQGPAAFVGAAIGAAMTFWALAHTELDTPDECKNFFLLAVPAGQVVLAGLVTDGVLARL